MPLQFTKPERITLKSHSDFNEKWVQQRIIDDSSLLGLGELDVIASEKTQPRAGRLDLLLHDDQLNRRYEVELMLGATDPSHIMRCIEYWDIERRRYPAYDHVAVLVAEDITSRFLNVISLLAGSIPLIAIQLVALRVDDKIVVHFVQVLDQTSLRSDDTYEIGPGSSGQATTDRAYWESRVSEDVMQQFGRVAAMIQELTGEPQSLVYRKRVIGFDSPSGSSPQIWLLPKKTLMRIGAYVEKPEAWVKRFEEIGLTASLRRGNKAVLVSYKPPEIETQGAVLRELLTEALDLSQQSTE